jgi:phosphatidylserine/phosphatidylglycerophosphate/cardiolipin synthase-like enzyme/uncharacterized membrane protein YdjX (TVP38/TMEM64 family)
VSRDAHATAGSPQAQRRTLLRPGRNCWRIERSTRTRCIQDAAEYFELARAAILRAQHSIFVLGWDITANLDLVPGAKDRTEPTRLAELLDTVVRRRRGLHCHVLVWDHSTLYALERDPFTRVKLGWLTHERVHFRFDDRHPLGGSHHDKVLVVDDRVAFAGSIDLTTHRWDRPAHRVDEPLRRNTGGSPYGPYHDVQLMVEGAAAAALGELARSRWRQLGVKSLPRAAENAASPWPDGVPSDLPPVQVAIARTEPRFQGADAIRECEALFHDAIAAARRSIYIENQYFTDAKIARALAARIAEPDGPDVVAVVPKECSGWLEQRTMGMLRSAVLRELLAADRHGRLRVLHPMASRRECVPTFVHAKVMIVDDELLRIGSANLAGRSMGMDSECDLAAAADGEPAARAGIARVRDRLLAEHLGVEPRDVGRACARERSLARAVDSLAGGDRTLVPVQPLPPPDDAEVATMRELVDPTEPIAIVSRLEDALPELEAKEDRVRRVARSLPLLVIALVALFLWRWSRGAERELTDIAELMRTAPSAPLAWAIAFGAFVVVGLTFLPLLVPAFAAALLLGGLAAAATACAGTCTAAAIGYVLGRAAGPQRLARWVGHRVYRLLRTMHRPGLLSIAALRSIPIASTTTVHLLCGAARVPAAAYWGGTLVGLLPAIGLACLVGGLLRRAFLQQERWAAVAGITLLVLLVAVTLRLRRLLLQQHVDRALREHTERSSLG